MTDDVTIPPVAEAMLRAYKEATPRQRASLADQRPAWPGLASRPKLPKATVRGMRPYWVAIDPDDRLYQAIRDRLYVIATGRPTPPPGARRDLPPFDKPAGLRADIEAQGAIIAAVLHDVIAQRVYRTMTLAWRKVGLGGLPE